VNNKQRKGIEMYMTEITEDRLSGLSEHIEKALSHIGKAMRCVSELEDEEDSEENASARHHGHRHYRDSYRDYDEDRAYRGSGRYSRY